MKKKVSVGQIVGPLKQAEFGVPVAELISKTGITEQTSYRRKANYIVWRWIKLARSGSFVKQLVPELTLDNTLLHYVLQRVLKSSRR